MTRAIPITLAFLLLAVTLHIAQQVIAGFVQCADLGCLPEELK